MYVERERDTHIPKGMFSKYIHRDRERPKGMSAKLLVLPVYTYREREREAQRYVNKAACTTCRGGGVERQGRKGPARGSQGPRRRRWWRPTRMRLRPRDAQVFTGSDLDARKDPKKVEPPTSILHYSWLTFRNP